MQVAAIWRDFCGNPEIPFQDCRQSDHPLEMSIFDISSQEMSVSRTFLPKIGDFSPILPIFAKIRQYFQLLDTNRAKLAIIVCTMQSASHDPASSSTVTHATLQTLDTSTPHARL
jgi:hypothetical protein